MKRFLLPKNFRFFSFLFLLLFSSPSFFWAEIRRSSGSPPVRSPVLQSEKAPFLQAAGARVQYTAFSQVTGVYLSDLAQRNLAEHPEEKYAEISLGLRGQYTWVSELRCTGVRGGFHSPVPVM